MSGYVRGVFILLDRVILFLLEIRIISLGEVFSGRFVVGRFVSECIYISVCRVEVWWEGIFLFLVIFCCVVCSDKSNK